MKELHIKRTASGLFRAYGMFLEYGTSIPARIWVGQAPNGPIFEDTILTLRDAARLKIEVLAGEDGLLFN